MKIKKGDIVEILAGDDKGKTGKVLEAFPRFDRVLVENINKKKRHQKATRTTKGQIVEKALPIHVSNVRVAKEKKTKVAPAKKAAKTVKK